MARSGSVSIIIPFFNADTTLADAIESALSQEGVDLQIVVVDDGSTDGSLAIARRFEPKIRILTGPNRGVSAARNWGISETTGEWCVFLDADDVLLPGTLKRRLETANTNRAEVIVCDWKEIGNGGDGTITSPVKSLNMAVVAADAESAFATYAWVTTSALMYRRAIVKRIGGFREDLPVIEDARFLFDAAYHGAIFGHSAHVGAEHHVLSDSLSRRDPALFWRCALLNGRQIEALWRARGALSPRQLAALSDVYNGAAHALFRACDPSFRQALAALRASRLAISGRNHLAEVMANVAGQPSAVRIASLWTASRRRLTNLIHGQCV